MLVNSVYPDTWPAPQTPYEAEALAFCRAWLANQQQFTLFTSGSTGTPKPIQLTRAQMTASAHLTGQTLGLRAGDLALVCLNARYVAGIMMLVRGLELGLPMTILEPSGNPMAGLDPATSTFAFTALVPLQLQTILSNPEPQSRTKEVAILNKMKAILVGGAATSLTLEQALQEIDAPIYATYGMTETVSHIALRRLNGLDASDVFTALMGVDLGTDARGCLHITSAATNFERIQTNDVVDLIADSNGKRTQFRLLGRADRVINSGGVKVQPEQVELLIQSVLATDKAALDKPIPRLFVAGLPDERLGQRVVVISEWESITDDQWQRLQHAIRETIGPYAVPKEHVTVARFAETPTGKVDQKATIAQIG